MTSDRASRSALLRPAVVFLPAAALLGIWIGLIPAAGGFFARDWMPAGAVIVGLALVSVLGTGFIVEGSWHVRWAVGCLAALTIWTFSSIAWSDSPGDAWRYANSALVALASVCVLTGSPWTLRAAEVLFAGFVIGVGVSCMVELMAASSAADATLRLQDGRWAEPLGYPNAQAALAAMAALGAVALSCRAGAHPAWKAIALGLAAMLACLALLPQSRGAVLGLALGLAAALVILPHRWRFLARMAVIGGALVMAGGPVLEVYEVGADERPVGPALRDAALAILLAAGAAAVGGLALAFAEERIGRVPAVQRVARIAGVLAIAACAVGAIGAAAAAGDRIGDALGDQWAALKNPGLDFGDGEDEASSSRLLDADPLQRYDYWRVALDGFQAAPIVGMGAGGFADRYEAERRFVKHSEYAHNLVLRLLGDLGLIGLLLASGFIGAVLAGAVRLLRGADPRERGVAAAAFAPAAYFFAHAQFDWLEAYPVMLGPALAFPLVALVAVARTRGCRPLRISRVTAIAFGVAGALAMASLALPWLSLRYRERAAASWRAAPAAAYRDLDRAAALDPLSAAPLLVKGSIALQRRDWEIGRAALTRAVERERGWLAHFELGLIELGRGDRRAAMRQLLIAQRLNPQEPAIGAAQEDIQSGRSVDPTALARRLFESRLFNRGGLP